MKDRNENRPGYKKTKIGYIPTNWECAALEEVAYVQTGLAKGRNILKNPTLLPYLRVANVQDGFLNLDEIKEIEIEKSDIARYKLRYGDVLFTEGGDFDKLGRGTIWKNEIDQCLHQNHVFAVRCDENRLLPYFLAALASGPYGRRYFTLCSKQSTNLASINSTQLKQFLLPLPPTNVQKKIAEILSTWDEAIEKTRKLIEAKKSRRKALMQQLLTGKRVHLSYHHDNWNIKPIEDLVEPISRPVPKPPYPYLSIGIRSHGKGTFQKIVEQPAKVMMDTLYRVEANDLIVNITFAWEGAIAIASEQDSGGLVSHRFPTYRIREREADIDFFRNLILTKKFVWDLGLISPGGAGRNRVLNQKDFLKMKVVVPSVEAQREIGKTLAAADKELHLWEDYLKALEKQKRGLMQKLLTGEIRVNL